MTDTMEKCENCSGNIGKLETPQIWNGSVVCWDCHKKLAAQQEEKESAERAVAQADYERKARQEMREEMAQVGPEIPRGSNISKAVTARELSSTEAQPRIPGYSFLNLISSFCTIVGLLLIVVGCITVIVLISDSSKKSGAVDEIQTSVAVASAIASAITGVFLCGYAELLSCIRDIARNSWKMC